LLLKIFKEKKFC